MKQANAVRVGREVSLNYRGLWLAFDWDWDADSVYLATDSDGEVWAYSTEPRPDDKGFYINSGIEEHTHSYKREITEWEDSLVEYEIK